MRSVLVAGCGALALALALPSCNSSDSPTTPGGNTSTITIVGENGLQSFTPNPASAGGRNVVWRNNDGDTHRIVANNGTFDTGNIAAGATSTAVPAPPDGLNYHCSIHPTMMFGAIGGAGGEAPPMCEEYCGQPEGG